VAENDGAEAERGAGGRGAGSWLNRPPSQPVYITRGWHHLTASSVSSLLVGTAAFGRAADMSLAAAMNRFFSVDVADLQLFGTRLQLTGSAFFCGNNRHMQKRLLFTYLFTRLSCSVFVTGCLLFVLCNYFVILYDIIVWS